MPNDIRLDHVVIAVSDWERANAFYGDVCAADLVAIEDAVAHLRAHGVEVEEGPVARDGARDAGISVYFRDPDGSLLEFISYATA